MRNTGRKIRLIVRQEATRSAGNGGNGLFLGTGGVTQQYVDENYLSKAFWSELFIVHTSVHVVVEDENEDVIDDYTEDGVLTPNQLPGTVEDTDEETGYKTTTTTTITSIEAKVGVWTTAFMSALGLNDSGGGGGGATALSQLTDVQLTTLGGGQALIYDSMLQKWVNGLAFDISNPQNGQVLTYNNGKWINAAGGGTGGGTVTSITAGTGLSGGTITSSGTIGINSTYQAYISHGEYAYNHLSDYILLTQLYADDQNPYGKIPKVGSDGVVELGKYIDFHAYNNNAWDYTTRLVAQGPGENDHYTDPQSGKYYWNTVTLPYQSGTLALTSDISAALQSYYTQSQVNSLLTAYYTKTEVNAMTWWGASLSNGIVSGAMTGVGNITAKNSGDSQIVGFTSIELNSHGTLSDFGGFIDFHYNGSSADYTSRIIEDASGRIKVDAQLYIPSAKSIRIGDGLLTWDANASAFMITDYAGNPANLCALGSISALGFNSSSNSTSVDSLIVRTALKMIDYASAEKTVMSILNTQNPDKSFLAIGHDWKSLNHDTILSGYNVRIDSGSLDEAVVINNSGLATFNGYAKSARFYLDDSRYLYNIGNNLYFYNGSSSIQIA